MSKEALTEPVQKQADSSKSRERLEESPDSRETVDGRILQLQRAIGNRRVAELVGSGQITRDGRLLPIQTRLRVGAPDDIYEKEADAVAEQVLARTSLTAASASGSDDDNNHRSLARKAANQESARRTMLQRIPIRALQQTLANRALARLLRETFPTPAIPALSRKCACGGDAKEECAECRENRLARQSNSASADGAGSEAPPIVEDVLATPGQPLAESARRTLEPGFGHDLSGVRVHDDSKASESASAVSALAYTVGNHVVFGAGQYSPGTDDGNRLLAHELTHTIQQTGGMPKRPSWDDVTPVRTGDEVSRPEDSSQLEYERPSGRVSSVDEPPPKMSNSWDGVARPVAAPPAPAPSATPGVASPPTAPPAAAAGPSGMEVKLSKASAAPELQRLSLDDVIPDAILSPIKALVSQVPGFGTGVTSKSDTAASGAQSEAETAADKVNTETSETVSSEQSKGEAAETGVQTQSANAAATTESEKGSGETQAGQIKGAVPLAEYATDPVKSATQPPPPSKLPGGDPAAPTPAADTWNCDEASILSKVSSVGKSVIDGLTKVVKAVVPESVLNFAQQGIAKLQSAIGTIKQKVEAAKKVVTEWIDNKLKPVKDAINKAVQFASDKINAAKRAITEKISQLTTWASSKWSALKTKVSTAVKDAIDWAKKGVGGLVDKAKSLAGRLWDALPERIQGLLTGAAAAIAAPIALAQKAAETAVTWVQSKASWVKEKLAGAADKATKFFAEKYQKIRGFVGKVGEGISKGITWVKNKVSAVGHTVYDAIDDLSGGRISKWRAAAAKRLAELKGEVCAITGAAAGPCVERFLPEPIGPSGKSFATLATKADITVPIEGVPVKVSAGASIKIERTSRKYNVVLSGEGFAGVGLPKKSSGGDPKGGDASGTVTVEGTLPNKVLAMLSLGSQGPAMPGVPIPFGAKPATPGATPPAPGATPAPSQPASGGPTPATPGATPAPPQPAAGGAQSATPGATPPGAQAPGGGGGASVDADLGEKVTVALTYTFDATADKTTCDGLGGLTAFLATQGAAALLPAPFSNLAAAGGQAAFADKLTSAKITGSQTGSVSLKGGAGGADLSLGAKAESGVSLESRNDEKGKSFTLTLFESLSGDVAANFAPEKIGLGKIGAGLAGRQELAIIYNLTLDSTDATFKQSLTGSVTLGAFAGMTGSLPASVRQQVQRLLVCLPGANEATVSFELSNNLANLSALAAAIDSELNKGSAATASGIWDAVSGYLKNSDNSFIQFSAKLNLTEKVLGVKAGGSAVGVSGSVDVSRTRGQEIVLCPPVQLEGSVGGSISTIAAAAIPGNALLCDDDELIKRFGNRRRDLNIDPDKDPKSDPRVDDPPIFESFRKIYNQLDSWNTFIRNNNADLYPEFQSTFQIDLKRKRWLDELKERAATYKKEFRDVSNTDPEKARRDYEDHVLGNIQKEIDDCNRAIAAWYRDKTGSTETIDEILERVHAGGTELWRSAWKAAILQVNRVLAETWPSGKVAILQWVSQKRAELPHVDLSGDVGELDYIGSLATGYKGPPKQQIRFNPDKFDVDANLPAPPLAKYAIAVDHVSPDRKRIFGRTTSIVPLKEFTGRTHSELSDRVKGYDKSEPFDVAIDAPELPQQEFSRLATERLYKLRTQLPENTYLKMTDELTAGGYIDPVKKAVRDALSEAKFKEMTAIMDRYEAV